MGKLHTLARIIRVLIRDPYALRRVLDEPTDSKLLSHDAIYGESYFQFVEETTASSADVIARSIIEAFHPTSVIDVGCGTGVLLERLQAEGVQVKGLEYAQAALKQCRARQLDVLRFDLTTDPLPQTHSEADVVVSMEVGQQLLESFADRYIDTLCQLAPVVVFSSGIPGQGDKRPVNEQQHSYWIEKFQRRGFNFNESLSRQWRHDWENAGAAKWFFQNIMIFQKMAFEDNNSKVVV